eukprot:scaffold166495_cov22-Tisochrysis_lutea.AAC.1
MSSASHPLESASQLRASTRIRMTMKASTHNVTRACTLACTQVRFEVAYYALKPDIKVIAPWREWDLNSRTKLIEYAEKNGIPVPTVS